MNWEEFRIQYFAQGQLMSKTLTLQWVDDPTLNMLDHIYVADIKSCLEILKGRKRWRNAGQNANGHWTAVLWYSWMWNDHYASITSVLMYFRRSMTSLLFAPKKGHTEQHRINTQHFNVIKYS